MKLKNFKLPETIEEGKRLHILNIIYRDSLWTRHCYTQERRSFLNNIRDLAEDGKIAMVFGGMDCDCVQYRGSVYIVDATVAAVEKEADDYGYWADGPWGYHLEKPSVAQGIKRQSRDLVMEAFENGHPHVVYA